MPDVQQEISDWLHTQPDWLQEAAEAQRRTRGVSDGDIQILVERLKTPEGQQVTTHRIFDGLTSNPAPTSELKLLLVGDISGIENLVPRHPLEFGAGNLCVIYGNNGSGKSGYTRLLKKVCGKPSASELKPNVFQKTPAVRKCRIGYRLAGVEHQVEWQANGAPIDHLRSVDFFDAHAAVAYVTQETAASYTPQSVALFEALATVCDQIRGRLQAEQDRMVSALPLLPPAYAASSVGSVYGALKPPVDDATLQRLIRWGAEDSQALEQLTERLKADDPEARANQKRSTKEQVDQIAQVLMEAAVAFGQERLVAIRALRAAAETKRRVSTESAQVALAKLDGVGSDTWRALWEAARDYTRTAYPGRSYPVTADALCVLCHQELGKEAQQRLGAFEEFIQGQLETEAKTAEGAYRNALEELPTVIAEEQIATRCQAAGLTEDYWVKRIGEFFEHIGKSREVLLEEEPDGLATCSAPPNSMLAELVSRSATLEREAVQHDDDATNFDRVQASKDKLNLEARRWTAQQSEAIHAEIARLEQMGAYEAWKRSATSTNVSRKAGEIAAQVITQVFVDRFNRELQALGASRIKVELIKARTEKGSTLHKLRLKDVRSGEGTLESVLSDGERRIVALAAFLADVAEQSHAAPFIFDDPISSLDQEFEWRVATRLAQLAQKRQVLVFTHRLSLYGAMEDAAEAISCTRKDEQLHQHCIESFNGVAGHPVDQAAWAANTTKSNNILLTRLGDAKKAGEASGPDAYRNLAQGVCSDFRKLLERTVEDDLLNQVVKRHRRSITTNNRIASLPRITQRDCKFIEDLMTKYSCFEHSQSLETPILNPEEPELRSDLESLKAWREEFKKRPVGVSE